MVRDKNPQHWKLLIFYFNPGESRLFVTKRTGLGWTLNFARPAAWALSAALIAIAVAVPLVEHSHLVR